MKNRIEFKTLKRNISSLISPLACFLLLIVVPLFSGAQKKKACFSPPAGVKFYSDIPYKEGNNAWLVDIAVPENVGENLPAVATIHGGGWKKGDKNGQRGLIVRFAQNGYVAMAVRYRLSGEAPFPACLQDVKSAIRFLRANADRYNVDPDRIGAYGNSAGAHLASMLGLVPVDMGFDDGANMEFSSVVNAVCAVSAPTDFSNWENYDSVQSVEFLDSSKGTLMERAQKASPISYVNKMSPPFLLIHGTKDKTVPASQSIRLASELRKVGAENINLILVDDLGHTPMLTHESLLWPSVLAFFDKTIGSKKDKLLNEIRLSQKYMRTKKKLGSFSFNDIKQFDLNNDEIITHKEFGGTNELFDRLDKDGDDKIDIRDLK
ncbi:alpha/beta hydrolase [Maribellus maritimus]|uniref:alpha/beta hydrolase n=1 Tax=Maribellus maritimus TaxID=2870838 RepID=UPI001EEBAF83|nr:alpha/beta hydrolase [Maribellus maritimus]MCG6187636.1 alpha/beta hydrolase [Maribellus maritimus]